MEEKINSENNALNTVIEVKNRSIKSLKKKKKSEQKTCG